MLASKVVEAISTLIALDGDLEIELNISIITYSPLPKSSMSIERVLYHNSPVYRVEVCKGGPLGPKIKLVGYPEDPDAH